MYTYKFSDAQSEKIKEQASLMDEFIKVDKAYGTEDEPSSPTKVTFDRMEYASPTEEEVQSTAKNSLQSYLSEGKSDIAEKYNAKADAVETQIGAKQNELSSKKENLKLTVDELKDNASKDAIKRGLARSSIVVNVMEAFDDQMLKQYAELDKNYTEQLDSLNKEKNLLSEQKQSALNSFDISYALKLSEKIDSINSEIEKKQAEVLKYNNDIAEKEAKYNSEVEEKYYDKLQQAKKNNMELADFVDKNGASSLERVKASEKYAIALRYFSNMNKTEALAELQSNQFYKNHLGSYYSILQTALKNS